VADALTGPSPLVAEAVKVTGTANAVVAQSKAAKDKRKDFGVFMGS
jgi:hypothetical protein